MIFGRTIITPKPRNPSKATTWPIRGARDRKGAASVVVPSLVFGHLRDRTGSTVPAILVHGWYNLGYFTLMG